jgi:hypothetical protein
MSWSTRPTSKQFRSRSRSGSRAAACARWCGSAAVREPRLRRPGGRPPTAPVLLTGLLAHWETVLAEPARLSCTNDLLPWEKGERARRGLERCLRSAHIGQFKPLPDFDWDWPTH